MTDARKMAFARYHALGNDYLAIRREDMPAGLSAATIRRVCHPNFGVGSDGILLGPLASTSCDFGVRIFNPDGSEAEKSGNGLRIFARFLWDEGLVGDTPFSVETLGGPVSCRVAPDGRWVTVEMGQVRFDSQSIPVAGAPREVLNEEIRADDRVFRFCAATVGNPHCVILCEDPTPEIARRYGPLIEVDPRFPNRTNVQFLEVLDERNIRIEIWERGAGYTLASGTSGTAAAAVAHRLGLCGPAITAHMPGGDLRIQFGTGFEATIAGPVTRICEGRMCEEMLESP